MASAYVWSSAASVPPAFPLPASCCQLHPRRAAITAESSCLLAVVGAAVCSDAALPLLLLRLAPPCPPPALLAALLLLPPCSLLRRHDAAADRAGPQAAHRGLDSGACPQALLQCDHENPPECDGPSELGQQPPLLDTPSTAQQPPCPLPSTSLLSLRRSCMLTVAPSAWVGVAGPDRRPSTEHKGLLAAVRDPGLQFGSPACCCRPRNSPMFASRATKVMINPVQSTYMPSLRHLKEPPALGLGGVTLCNSSRTTRPG